jgi:TonB family protein
MSPDPQQVPEVSSEGGLGSLRGCLVEGNAEQQTRERRIRRRALFMSVVFQSAILTLLFLVPLFGKTERIAMKDFVPIPPYGHHSNHTRNNTRPTTNRRLSTRDTRFIFHPPTSVVNPHPEEETDPGEPIVESSTVGEGGEGPGCPWCVDIGEKNRGPQPPPQTTETFTRPQIVHMTTIDPAMLISRVEPVYPVLARQTHREGRVELRAIIGTDGTIQSLQVVSGDSLFLLSAREAVQQWRYKPTYLNGQAVQIDTYITVVYTMQH